MAKDPEILRFLTTEPFREMLQTYARLKPPGGGAGGPVFRGAEKVRLYPSLSPF